MNDLCCFQGQTGLTYVLDPSQIFKNPAQVVFPFFLLEHKICSNRSFLKASKQAVISPILKQKPLPWQDNPNFPFLIPCYSRFPQNSFYAHCLHFLLLILSYILVNKAFIQCSTETTFVSVITDLHRAKPTDSLEVIILSASPQYLKQLTIPSLKSFLYLTILDGYFSNLSFPLHLHGSISESEPHFLYILLITPTWLFLLSC